MLASWTSLAPAQEAVLNQMYGSGVHAYFAGDYNQALQDLTMAIEDGSKDPRVYYFRGLVELRLGMSEVADEDFARGAELEAKTADRFYPVSRSLERVQGYDRLALEKHRALARAAVYRAQQAQEKERYEQFQRAEQEVLREPRRAEPLPAPAAQPAADPAAEAPAKPAAADPFADEPAEEAPAADDDAAMEDDPFGEAPAEDEPAEDAPAAEDDDPFAAGVGKDDQEELDEAMEDENQAEADDDPFGAGGPDADDDTLPDAGDPFADDAEPADAEEAPADDEAPADEEMPAEDEKPADDEAEEDPFG
jgi:hypothetical protein